MDSSTTKYFNNNIQTKLNDNYHLKLYWHEHYGNYFYIDILYITVLCPVSVIGVFLNLITLKIFKSRCFSTKNVYKYFKVYTINSLIICFLFSINFLFRSPTILEYTNTYAVRLLGIKIMFPIFATIYFYLSILDIVISLERVSHFLIKLKKLHAFNPYKVCTWLFLINILINLIYILVYEPGHSNVNLNLQTNYSIYYNTLSTYGKTKIGQLNIAAIYILRDVVILFIVIILNVLSIILLNKYLKRRRIFLNVNAENISLMNSINTRLTVMVIVMLTISSLEHLLFSVNYFYFLIKRDIFISNLCNMISIIGISVKQVSNFIILYLFNRVFRAKFKNIVRNFFQNKIISISFKN